MPISNIYELTEDIAKWVEPLAPNRGLSCIQDKMLDEMAELIESPVDPGEMADMMILLLDYCRVAGVDIVEAVHKKMIINRGREWETIDGKLQHKEHTESGKRETVAYCAHCQDPITGGTPVQCLHDVGESCLIDGPGRPQSLPD